MFQVRMSEGEMATIEKAARKDSRPTGTWARLALLKAAALVLILLATGCGGSSSDEGPGTCAISGAHSCDGSTLVSCDGAGHWESLKDCATFRPACECDGIDCVLTSDHATTCPSTGG